MTQKAQYRAAVDNRTHSSLTQNTRAVIWTPASLPAGSRTNAKGPPAAMIDAPDRVRPAPSARRTEPNKSERSASRADLKEPEKTRKNLKEPESLAAAIPRKTLGIRLSTPAKKISFRKPESRRSPVPAQSVGELEPGIAHRLAFPSQNRSQTAKTILKLTKTIHPARTISRKTLAIGAVQRVEKNFPSHLTLAHPLGDPPALCFSRKPRRSRDRRRVEPCHE